MQGDEARLLLGFPPNSQPTFAQIKAAYKKKVWESHPDLFPVHEKPGAESKFKLISEAYTCLLSGARGEDSASATYSRVVRTGMPRGNGGRRNPVLIRIPFLFIILGTIGLGSFNATRAYKKQKEHMLHTILFSLNPNIPSWDHVKLYSNKEVMRLAKYGTSKFSIAPYCFYLTVNCFGYYLMVPIQCRILYRKDVERITVAKLL